MIGEIKYTTLVITPFKHEKMAIDNLTYWTSRKSLVIGHRGAGAGNAARARDAPLHRTHVQENTVLSFVTAASLGAEYVEFDVQLTKDMVPIIYHNFEIHETGFSVPVHRLTLEEFLRVKVCWGREEEQGGGGTRWRLCDDGDQQQPKKTTGRRGGRCGFAGAT